jgi:hypothetical protein
LRIRDASDQRRLEQPGPRHFLSAHREGLHEGTLLSNRTGGQFYLAAAGADAALSLFNENVLLTVK